MRASNLSLLSCPHSDCTHTLRVDDTLEFSIQAIDSFGTVVTVGGESFSVLVGGPEAVTYLIQDHNNGSYTGTVCPHIAGKYVIQVYLEQWLIGECSLTVEAGPPVSNTSFVISGSFEGKACDDATPSFVIQARDAFGNNLQEGGVQFQVVVEAPNGENSTASVQDNGDGTYTASYSSQISGNYSISVLLGGVHIFNSPMEQFLGGGTQLAI